jgi:hypothetical protein
LHSSIQEKNKNENYETFVKNIRISYENNNEIKIQLPGKKAGAVTCESLGLRDSKVLAWQTLLQIIQDPPHIYDIGQSYKISSGIRVQNNEYHRKIKRLTYISLKMVEYFNKEYSVGIPKNYRLFETAKDKGTGKYRPIFSVTTNREKSPYKNKCEKLSKEDLIKEIKNNFKKYKDSNDELSVEQLTVAIEVSREKNLLTDQEVKDLVDSKSDKEFIQDGLSDIRYDQHENAPNKERDY